MLAQVVNALALVRLRRTLGTDLGGNLADLLLVDALDVDVGVVGALEGDALGSGVDHRVRVTEGQVEVLALELDTVADAGELEDLGVASETPVTMFWMRARVRPWRARVSRSSSGRETVKTPSATSMVSFS